MTHDDFGKVLDLYVETMKQMTILTDFAKSPNGIDVKAFLEALSRMGQYILDNAEKARGLEVPPEMEEATSTLAKAFELYAESLRVLYDGILTNDSALLSKAAELMGEATQINISVTPAIRRWVESQKPRA